MGLLERLFSKAPSRDEFAQIVIRALADKGISSTHYNPKEFSIVGDDTNTIFLENSFVTYCKAGIEQRARILEHLVGTFAEKTTIPPRFAAALPSLMPIVRASSYFSLVELHLKTRSADVDVSKLACQKKQLADGLAVVIAYDTEHSIMQVNQETFDGWGVSFDDALVAAKDNLREKTDKRLITEVSPGVYQGAWNDSYDSARMLLTDFINGLPLDGAPVVFVPNRDQLWLTGNRNIAGLKHVLKAGGESHFLPHPLSPSLYLLNDGAWGAYFPENAALREQCLNLQRRREAMDYGQQQDSLKIIYEREKRDVFLATYTVFQRQDGSQYSTCVWSNGVDSSLPKADMITFFTATPKKWHITVPWGAAFPIVAGLMEQQEGLEPVRYRVSAYPNPEQIAALRRAAV